MDYTRGKDGMVYARSGPYTYLLKNMEKDEPVRQSIRKSNIYYTCAIDK